MLPTIAAGTDIRALIGVFMPRAFALLKAKRAGETDQELDAEELNAALKKLPDEPDEELR
jgi:hypothetical protein